jgi:hypothetical protein
VQMRLASRLLAGSAMRGVSLFLATATAMAAATGAAGCVETHPLPLRFDPSQSTVRAHNLEGQRVAVGRVRDAREDDASLGRHRDGILRVPSYQYLARESVEEQVGAILRTTLREAGAAIVDKGAGEDIALDVDILELDVVTDGPTAGEETFGVVGLRATVADGAGHVVSKRRYDLKFADPDAQDAGMLGDAVYRLLGSIVSGVKVNPRGAEDAEGPYRARK